MHHRHESRHEAHLREFARSRGPRGRGGHGRGGGRARRGGVRAAILALLAERPMHGYEMIKELEERTDGAWTPSAGSIYPTLQMLEDEGLIKGEESDGKRRFGLTDEGAAAQEAKADEQTPWDAVKADAAPEQVHLGASMKKLHHAIRQAFVAGDPGQQQRVRELLDESRRKIYAILAEQD